MKKFAFGYMTVEATFIMPITFGIYILIIFTLISLYDRILMDQDLARTVVKAHGAMINNDYRKELNLQEAKAIFDENRFICLKVLGEEYRIQGDTLKVFAEGEEYKKGYEIWVLDPVDLLRLEKQIKDIKEEKEEGI